jgi:hypothetical protein
MKKLSSSLLNFKINSSGAGGNLREEQPQKFKEAHTRAWTGQAHLLLVELSDNDATLMPVSGLMPDGSRHLMTARAPDNEIVSPPFVVKS